MEIAAVSVSIFAVVPEIMTVVAEVTAPIPAIRA